MTQAAGHKGFILMEVSTSQEMFMTSFVWNLLQMSKLEQCLHKEKTTWQEELSTLEKKLLEAGVELENRNAQIEEMANSVRWSLHRSTRTLFVR